MSTSGTYNFSSPIVETIVNDAYERIGIIPDVLTSQQIQSAIRSINFTLTSWTNNYKGLKLWTVQQNMLSLNAGQATYNLPPYTIDILEAQLRTSTRNLGGTPFTSAGGNAANAFDGNPNTACTQTAPNGYISYTWTSAQYAIALVGIQSNVTTIYTLALEYSNDGTTWFPGSFPVAQSYPAGTNIWFVIPAPTLGTSFRVRETGGATLNIQEIYFNTMINDTVVTRNSRSEYEAIPNKNQIGRPSSFLVLRTINPTVTLWPAPNNIYNNLFFTTSMQIQDAGQLTSNVQIPSRFIEPLCADVSHRLAVKNEKVNLIDRLKAYSDAQFTIAAEEDRERVPLRIYGDYMQGWAQS